MGRFDVFVIDAAFFLEICNWEPTLGLYMELVLEKPVNIVSDLVLKHLS